MEKTSGHIDPNGVSVEIYHGEPFRTEAPKGLFWLEVIKGEMKSFDVEGIVEMRHQHVYRDGVLHHESQAWNPCEQTIMKPR